MKIPIYQVDAFSSSLFRGNPAAICIMKEFLADDVLQAIAAENNLSATAYLVKQEGFYNIRWFTPSYEVPLCGHGTLASAFVITNILDKTLTEVKFQSQSGMLTVTKTGDLFCLDFPIIKITPCIPPKDLLCGIYPHPKEVYTGLRYVLIYESEKQIRDIKLNREILSQLDKPGISISAPGIDVDFVSRYFIPAEPRFEDPVTGTAHCWLTPYWAKILEKENLTARQLSTRGGELICELAGNRILIRGSATLYMSGHIFL